MKKKIAITGGIGSGKSAVLHIFEEMGHFFTVYKNLENKETAVNEVSGYETSLKIIDKAINNYVEKFCK